MKLRGVTFDLWSTDVGNKAPTIPSVFGNNFVLEDYLLGQKKLCPFSSVLRAKRNFGEGNRGLRNEKGAVYAILCKRLP